MINEIFEKICKTEECRLLNDDTIQKIDTLKRYKNVIEVSTEISLQSGVKEVVLYIGIPNIQTSLPKIFIKSESYDELKFLPHINKDLSICIYDEALNHIFHESSLPAITEVMIYKAKRIIAQHDEPELIKTEFEREFKAYWEISYDKNDSVNEIGVSIISGDSLPYKGYHFKSPVNGFRYLIYQESETFGKFKRYLDFRNIQYDDIEVFEVEYVNRIPPFHLSFGESVTYIQEQDKKKFKQAINKNGMQSALIFFRNLDSEYFGWIYSRSVPSLSVMQQWHKKLSSWEVLNNSTFAKSLVERLSFSDLTPERLESRTIGYSIETYNSICIVGLGSVGSNLLNFLMKLPINKFQLIDSDILKLENIYRYQYGFDKIGMDKVEIAKESIINKNPFCEVIANKNSIVDVLNNDSEVFNRCDLNIVVVGNTMIEKFIIEHLVKTGCDKPLIIFWVEAYMASGQMICLCPKDFSKAIELIIDFPYGVLINNDQAKVYLKEGSCQTGYFPYSEKNLTLFLSAMIPHLFRFITVRETRSSQIFTWLGDKEFIIDKGLQITEFARSNNSFETLIKDL